MIILEVLSVGKFHLRCSGTKLPDRAGHQRRSAVKRVAVTLPYHLATWGKIRAAIASNVFRQFAQSVAGAHRLGRKVTPIIGGNSSYQRYVSGDFDSCFAKAC